MNNQPILIADIGGTNARFALATDNGGFYKAKTLLCKDYAAANLAIDAYLRSESIGSLHAICFAAAGPIRNQTIQFTNNHWQIDMAELESQYQAQDSHLLNDFEAIAYSLPSLSLDQLCPVGGNWELQDTKPLKLGVLGPGSGLGVGGIVKSQNSHLSPIVTEGGHSGFSPQTDYQAAILKALLKNHSYVSNELFLSGPGIANIYHAICDVENKCYDQNSLLSAKDISHNAKKHKDQTSLKTLELFFEILGQLAGDVALHQTAVDGIYIAGGIVQRYQTELCASRFRAGFENKGKQTNLLKSIPTWLITEANPGLIGASIYASLHLN